MYGTLSVFVYVYISERYSAGHTIDEGKGGIIECRSKVHIALLLSKMAFIRCSSSGSE